MRAPSIVVLAPLVAAVASCAAIAGLEDDYSVQGSAAGATDSGTASGTPAGTGAGTQSGTGGAAGSTPSGGPGGTNAGGGPLGGGGTGATGGSGATGGTGPTWQQIDSFAVPTTGETLQSSVTLQSGVTYHLIATGYFQCTGNGAVACDAEYVDRPPPDDMAGGFDFGMAINDLVRSADKTPYWGTYNPSHSYQIDWIGDGSPITVTFHDPDYTNNSGSLHLTIEALQ